jgi:hypothetical protein
MQRRVRGKREKAAVPARVGWPALSGGAEACYGSITSNTAPAALLARDPTPHELLRLGGDHLVDLGEDEALGDRGAQLAEEVHGSEEE